MSSVIGNPGSLRDLNRRLQQIPKVLAQAVAAKVAPELTTLAQAAYSGGSTVYGESRPAGKHGPLDLVVTGDTKGFVRFTAVGTLVRAVLGTPYARFLIGKYKILPTGALPFAWSKKIGDTARIEISRVVMP